MAIQISYTDQETAINIYCLLMNSAGLFYKPATQTFVAFATLADHAFYLSEGSARTYSTTLSINPSSGDYTLKTYKRTGVSPNLATDLLRNVKGFYYDSVSQTEISDEEMYSKLQTLLTNLAMLDSSVEAMDDANVSQYEETLKWLKSIASKVRAH